MVVGLSADPSSVSHVVGLVPPGNVVSQTFGKAAPRVDLPSRSFKDALSGKAASIFSPSELECSTFRGMPAFLISDESMAKLAAPFEFTLVGKFAFRRPSIEVIRKFFYNLKLSGSFSVSLLDNRHIAIQLSNDLDYSRIFAHRSYYISNCQMKLLKWTPFFDVKEESPIVPVWISFPNLRLHLINHKVIHTLASVYGRPLQTDQATASKTRPSIARVLVELDVSIKHPNEIWIGSELNGYAQKVEFENLPIFCPHCKTHGHTISECFILNPQLKPMKEPGKLIYKPKTVDSGISLSKDNSNPVIIEGHKGIILSNVDIIEEGDKEKCSSAYDDVDIGNINEERNVDKGLIGDVLETSNSLNIENVEITTMPKSISALGVNTDFSMQVQEIYLQASEAQEANGNFNYDVSAALVNNINDSFILAEKLVDCSTDKVNDNNSVIDPLCCMNHAISNLSSQATVNHDKDDCMDKDLEEGEVDANSTSNFPNSTEMATDSLPYYSPNANKQIMEGEFINVTRKKGKQVGNISNVPQRVTRSTVSKKIF